MLLGVVFLGALVVVAALKLWQAHAALRWIWDPADPSLRGLIGVALLPTLGVTAWLSAEGLDPPSALVLGAVLGLGILIASAGVLGLEGLLVERESTAIVRAATQTPPASSAMGRAGAVLAGCALAGAAMGVIGWLE